MEKSVTDISVTSGIFTIPSGWTRYGDIVMKDTVTTNKTWSEAITMKEIVLVTTQSIKVTYSDGSTKTIDQKQPYMASILSKETLEKFTAEQRKTVDGKWYWTSTAYGSGDRWFVNVTGDFYIDPDSFSNDYGGARLGFTL